MRLQQLLPAIDEDIVTLKNGGPTAADALEANRQDIDANKAAIDKKPIKPTSKNWQNTLPIWAKS